VFEIVVAVAVQSVFRLKMHQNKKNLLKKNIFDINTSKRTKNINKFILNKIKNLKFIKT